MLKKSKFLSILAIETSCDDTAIALVKCSGDLKSPQFKILKNTVSSQVKVHQPFHGVVPNLAKREHIKNLPKILKQFNPSARGGSSSGGKPSTLNPDLIAVTIGPGLEPALWAGITFAETLAKELKKPLTGVNHLEGHIYSNWLPKVGSLKLDVGSMRAKRLGIKHLTSNAIAFPAIVLIVSGGHTILLKMDSLTKWIKLGETLDDAAGEAFDKVARMLGLKYPGGPEISRLAAKGDPKAIKFPRPMLKTLSLSKGNRYDFSFSGLKTSVLYYLRDHSDKLKVKSSKLKVNVAASFQQAAIDVLVKKTSRAAQEYKAKSILLCGGVAANKLLRQELKVQGKKLKVNFLAPAMDFNTDNATMIAAAAYINILAKKSKFKIEANGNLNL